MTGHGFSCGQLAVDVEARRVWVNGEERTLALKEFDLLVFLASVPGKAWSKASLLAGVWGAGMQAWQHPTVTEHMRRLRNKLALDPERPPWLQTVSAFGYRYERRDRPRWEPDQGAAA